MSLLESEVSNKCRFTSIVFFVNQEADCSEENLAELAQYQPANESELITQAHRSMVLLKGLRIAVKDCLNKTKTGAKVSVFVHGLWFLQILSVRRVYYCSVSFYVAF